MDYLFLFIGLLIGLIPGYLWAKLGQLKDRQGGTTASELKEKYILREIWEEERRRNQEQEQRLEKKESEALELNKAIAAQEQMIDQLREQAQVQDTEYRKMQEQMRLDFENLANRLLEEKSKKFSEQNHQQLQTVLSPLQDRLRQFEQRVELLYSDENKQRAALGEQIKGLTELNTLMGREARQLTQALKGESKVQGHWGEFILEKILEKSGLSRGREYTVQETYRNEEGQRRQPDLIIHLPFQRHLIIDAKVSLTAYERYCSSGDEAEKNRFLREHLQSLQRHVDELSGKSYQQLYGLQSLDFVLMFIPIEPAFSLALQSDNDLFYSALEKNILPVSPSTLLATLRTVSNLWRQEQQSQNALEIARQGGLLYDKFVRMVEELELLGQRMQTAQNSFQGIMQGLSSGRGNLMQRAQRLKELGAKTSKTLPEQYLNDWEE